MNDPLAQGSGPQSVSDNAADIAIVGMAAHLPGAEGIAAYWNNLRNGIESIRNFDRETLIAAGEAPHLLERPDYVPAATPLDGFAEFDADSSGCRPRKPRSWIPSIASFSKSCGKPSPPPQRTAKEQDKEQDIQISFSRES